MNSLQASYDPIFDARQNVIEACKHLIQAEEHLFVPDRRCPDCVNKHLLAAESYADELVSLPGGNQWTRQAAMLGQVTRKARQLLEQGVPAKDVAQLIRATRKPCVAATGSFKLERMSHAREFYRENKGKLLAGALAIGALVFLRR